jgi:hypothetical protein
VVQALTHHLCDTHTQQQQQQQQQKCRQAQGVSHSAQQSMTSRQSSACKKDQDSHCWRCISRNVSSSRSPRSAAQLL